MASNRGANAVAPPQNFNSDRDESYYKSRDGGNSNFNWAQNGGSAGTAASSGVPGGSWGVAPTGAPPRPSGGMSVAAQSRAAAHGVTPARDTTDGIVGNGATPSSDGSYENTLVMELCPPGGMKAEPPPEKLESFIRSIPSLNADFICPALLDALEDGQPWIIKAKALCVIERIIIAEENNNEVGHNYSDFFHTCAGELEPLAGHARSAIREPARKVLKLLGIERSTTVGAATSASKMSAPPAPTSAPPPAPAPPNLLDFDDNPVVETSLCTGNPIAPPPASAPPPPVAAAPSAPLPASTSGLFDDMNLKAAPSKESVYSQPIANGSELSPAPTAAVQPLVNPTSSDLFGDVKLKLTEPGEGTETAVVQDFSSSSGDAALSVGIAAAGTGSAFGFISGDNKAPPRAETAAKESFDPLLSLGVEPDQAQKMQQTQAQIAQMQTIAYQQNLVRMQQQMQQMQMAMQMQMQGQGQRKGSGTHQMMMMSQQRHGSGVPINPNVMTSNAMSRQIPGTGDATPSFSFLDNPNQEKKKENHAFDFVMDSMKTEGKK